MNCVTCKAALEPHSHEGMQLDRCPNGCGMWLGTGELQHIAEQEGVPRTDAERASELERIGAGFSQVVAEINAQESPRLCPVCGGALRKAEYAHSGIVTDRCGGHGVWLDSGELERVEAFAEAVRRTV